MVPAPVVPTWRRYLGYAFGGTMLLGALAGVAFAAYAIWWPLMPGLAIVTAIVFLLERGWRR